MTVDLGPSQQQVICDLRVNYMEWMDSSYQSYSQTNVHKTKNIGIITSKDGHLNWLPHDSILRHDYILRCSNYLEDG